MNINRSSKHFKGRSFGIEKLFDRTRFQVFEKKKLINFKQKYNFWKF